MPCPQCDQVYPFYQYMYNYHHPIFSGLPKSSQAQNHLHLVHWGWIVQACDFCGETFFQSEQMKPHKNKTHLNLDVDHSNTTSLEFAQNQKKGCKAPRKPEIDGLLKNINKEELAAFTRSYISTVQRHLNEKHQQFFTHCLECFTSNPLPVLFAGKLSPYQLPEFHRQGSFQLLWKQEMDATKLTVGKEAQDSEKWRASASGGNGAK